MCCETAVRCEMRGGGGSFPRWCASSPPRSRSHREATHLSCHLWFLYPPAAGEFQQFVLRNTERPRAATVTSCGRGRCTAGPALTRSATRRASCRHRPRIATVAITIATMQTPSPSPPPCKHCRNTQRRCGRVNHICVLALLRPGLASASRQRVLHNHECFV